MHFSNFWTQNKIFKSLYNCTILRAIQDIILISWIARKMSTLLFITCKMSIFYNSIQLENFTMKNCSDCWFKFVGFYFSSLQDKPYLKQGWASELKYLLGNTEQVRANQSDWSFSRSDPITFFSNLVRSDIQILKCASEQIRSDHIRSQNVRSDQICDRIGYFLRTVKLISQNYIFKSVFFYH
jgi:hypothetical protein